jgi:hypothetical protein
MQLVSMGILAELVTSYNIRAEDTYSIAETLEARKGRDEEHSLSSAETQRYPNQPDGDHADG